MEEKKQLPQIRFKGYVDVWEQRKLSEIADKVTEKNTGLQYVETLTNSAEFGIISQRDFFDHDIAKLSSLDGYYIVKNEDFVYNPRISTSAPVGPINRNKLGRTGVMSPLYTVFRPHDVDTTYLEHFFKCVYWHSFMNFNGDSGARSDRFSIKDNVFFQMPIPLPHIDEQRKIGELLTCLDNLITLHQRKYDKLVNIKKSMLEKMFPKNGRDVPEIRFRGFTEAWEQRKLGEVGKARSGIGFPDSEQGGAFGIPFFKVSDMNSDGNENEMTVANNYVTPTQITTHRWSPIEELPAIFFAKVGAAVMLNRKRLCRFPFLLDNNTMAYSLDCTKWNADFAKAIFETVDLTSLVQVGALPSYNAGDVEAMEIFLPSLPEQAYIGAYFKSLDNLITLHQRKLEKLKNIKKSMLDKMFV